MEDQGREAGIADLDDVLAEVLDPCRNDGVGRWFGEPGFRGCGFINAYGELGSRSEEVAAVVRETKLAFQEYVEDLVRTAGGSDRVALQIVLLAEGAQTTAAITGSPSMIASSARAAAATLLDANLGSTA